MTTEQEIEFNVEKITSGQRDFDNFDEFKRKRPVVARIIRERPKDQLFRSQRKERLSESQQYGVPVLATSIQSFRNTKGTATTGPGFTQDDEPEIFMNTTDHFDLPSPIRLKRPTLPISASVPKLNKDGSLIGIIDGNHLGHANASSPRRTKQESVATDRLRDRIMKEQKWFVNKKYQFSGKVPVPSSSTQEPDQQSSAPTLPLPPRVKCLMWKSPPSIEEATKTPVVPPSATNAPLPKATGYKADIRMTERGLLQPAEDYYSSARRDLGIVRQEFEKVKKVWSDAETSRN